MQKPRQTSPARTVATMGFIGLVTLALILTIIGASQLIDEVMAAHSVKSGVIAIVLDLGVVVVGPVLVVAYFHLMPRMILVRVLDNIRSLLLGHGKNVATGHRGRR